MSENGKLMPHLDQQSTKLLNLTVLQRIDPFVGEILITAAHVTFYEFNIDLSQWSRKDVEGSLFVVKRNTQPRFQFIVMNRRNTDNLVENLLGDFEFEVQIPILNAYSKVPQKSKVPSTKSEFEELEAVPTIAVMDGPLEPPSLAASNVTDLSDDPAFVYFFSTALNIGNASNAAAAGHSHQILSPIPLPSQPSSVSPILPTLQSSSSLSTSDPLMPLLDATENNSNQTTNLVKPSLFFVPPPSSTRVTETVSSSVPAAPPLNLPVNLQHTHGAPLLQPFPPPTPPPSLAPASFPTPNHGPVISKDKVRVALLVLVQDNQFIDMVYRTLLNAQH